MDKLLLMVVPLLLLQIKEPLVDLELAVLLVTPLEVVEVVLEQQVQMVMVIVQKKVVMVVMDFLII